MKKRTVNTVRLLGRFIDYLQETDSREKNRNYEKFNRELNVLQESVFNYARIFAVQDINDIKQDVHLKLLTKLNKEKLHKITEKGGAVGFKNYLAVVTLNTTRDYLRRINSFKKYQKRLAEWADDTGLQWDSNHAYSDDYPQSILIIPKANRHRDD